MFKKYFKKVGSAIVALTMTATLASSVSSGFITQTKASAEDNDNYAKLLQYSMYFYDANMCGNNVSESSRLSWRSDCHTADDVDGGFHDAGDHCMFGLPQGFSASTLGWAYYEFKDAYETTGQTDHYKTINDYFCSFFRNSTILDSSGTVTKFLYQKGNGTTDHNYWGAPEAQTNSRQQYWTTNSASDIAAEYAAALALSYINFGNSEDLKYAKSLYAFSTKYNSIATDGPSGFYDSSSYQDDQAWAAGWLYLATNDSSYKTDCANKQVQYLGWTHGWDNVYLGAACVYSHITNDWSKVNSFLKSECTDANSYFFMDKWGSARLNVAMQFCALSATKNSSADYSAWCKGQMNYILGDNPANTCFVVGFASNSASKPHHRAASGTSSANSTADSKYTLVGALVGGPTDANGTYSDDRSDYVCNEVALDYNAGLVGAAAGLYTIYKTGSLDLDIVGTRNVSDTQITTSANQTSDTTATTTAASETSNVSVSGGDYTLTVNTDYDLGSMTDDDKMIGFNWSEFGIPSDATITSVDVNMSAQSGNIGTWQGAFGTSMKEDPYWTMTSDMSERFTSSSGTVTWDIDSDTSSNIQTSYGGVLKFGVWWVDCTKFTIKSVVVHTTGGTAVTTKATTTTTKTTTTTTKATTTTTKATTTTTKATTTTTKATTTTTKATTTTTKATTTTTKATTTTTKATTTTTTTTTKATTTTTKATTTTTTTTLPVTTTTTTTSSTINNLNKLSGSIYTNSIVLNVGDEYQLTDADDTIYYSVSDFKIIGVTSDNVIHAYTSGKAIVYVYSQGQKLNELTVLINANETEETQTEANQIVKGDLNQDNNVSVSDYVMLAKYILKSSSLSKSQYDRADLNDDTRINVIDLRLLKLYF